MADTFRIKRRAAGGAAGPPATLAAAEIAFNEQDNVLYYGKGNSGGLATSIIAIGGPGAFGSGGTIAISDTPPGSPTPGMGWWDSVAGQLFLWFDDGNTTQWVPVVNQPGPIGLTGPTGPTGATGAPGAVATFIGDTPPGSPVAGNGWWNSLDAQLYIYYTDPNTSQWVPAINVPSPAGSYLPLTGGTLTDVLAITPPGNGGLTMAPIAGTPQLILRKPTTGNSNQIQGWLNATQRWNMNFGNAVAESGGNVGNDFTIQRYNDAGTFIDTPFTITRSNGVTSVNSLISTSNISAGSYSLRAGVGGVASGSVFNINFSPAVLWIDTTNIGQFSFVSDYRIKENVADLPSTWDRVKALRPISYTHKDYSVFKADPERLEHWGFLAHELQETLTESAATGHKDEENLIQSPNPHVLLAALTKALQEAMSRIEALESR